MKITLQFGEEEYRLVGEGEAGNMYEGDLTPYGEAAMLEAAGARYMALCEKVGQDVNSVLPDEVWVTSYNPVQAQMEDVDFDGDGEAETTVAVEEEEEGEEEEDGEEGEGDGEGEEAEEEEVEELK